MIRRRSDRGRLPAILALCLLAAGLAAQSELPVTRPYVIGLQDGRSMTGMVDRVDNTGVVLRTEHGSVTVPWERMDRPTLEMFGQYIPGLLPPPEEAGGLPGDVLPLPPDTPSEPEEPEAEREPSRDVFGVPVDHRPLWIAAWAAAAAIGILAAATLAPRKRRRRSLWIGLTLLVPALYLLFLVSLPADRPLFLAYVAPATALVIPLLLGFLPRTGPSPEELQARIQAVEPPKPRTISLKKHSEDESDEEAVTEIDARVWGKERTIFDRRFFERYLIPWLRNLESQGAPRPRIILRVGDRGIRARRIVQTDEVGVLIAFEESGDPLANGERYPYTEIEEITIARSPAPGETL